MEEKGQIASIFEPNTWTLTYQVAKLKVKLLKKDKSEFTLACQYWINWIHAQIA